MKALAKPTIFPSGDTLIRVTAIIGLAVHVQVCQLFAQGTAFIYQGRLDSGGVPYSGNAEFQPTLWDAASGGTQVAENNPTQVMVSVTNGLFVLPLDFGANFPGADRWLQLEVRTGFGPFTVVSPRQKLTPMPYAITAGNLSGMLPATQLSGTLPSANLGGTYSGAVTFNNAANNFNGNFNGSFSGNGEGLTALNASRLTSGTVPDSRLAANVARTNQVWLLAGNAGTTPGTHFLGTTDNQPLELRVNGLRALRLEDNGDSYDPDTLRDGAPNVVGGSPGNFVRAGVVGATIAGGGATNYGGYAYTNSVLSDFGVVGGGLQNTIAADSPYATIAGGQEDEIGTNSYNSAIGGGRDNDIGTNSLYSAIEGGWRNTIAANSRYATIPGGTYNFAANYAFAAGRRAKANHTGSFVWGDSTPADIASTTANSVTMRASGGYRLFSNSGANIGVRLASGSASWTSICDCNAKENFAPVDAESVLAKMVALPIATWNYKSQDPAIRHMGPTAQDFKAAFGLGESDTGITSIDADGVALAAIQGLNRKLEAENAALRQELAELKSLVQTLADKLNKGAP